MDNGKTTSLRVLRYDPSSGEEPLYQEYVVPLKNPMNVLQALDYIYQNLDSTIAYRNYCCNKGICQSCIMKIDGKRRRACSVALQEGQSITVEPVSMNEVVRDLVVAWNKI